MNYIQCFTVLVYFLYYIIIFLISVFIFNPVYLILLSCYFILLFLKIVFNIFSHTPLWRLQISLSLPLKTLLTENFNLSSSQTKSEGNTASCGEILPQTTQLSKLSEQNFLQIAEFSEKDKKLLLNSKMPPKECPKMIAWSFRQQADELVLDPVYLFNNKVVVDLPILPLLEWYYFIQQHKECI